MKYIDFLNKQIFLLVASTIIISLFIIAASYCLVSLALKNKINKTYVIGDLVVSLQENIDKNLDVLSDYEGLKSKANNIMITNNGEDSSFKIFVCQKNNYDEYIRVGFDGYLVRDLNQFDFDFGCYLIYSGEIREHSTQEHNIRIWQNIKYKDIDTIKGKFKIKVEKGK